MPRKAVRRAKAKTRPTCTAPRFLAVDFFCGAGGTTRGLIDAGGYVIAGIDKDGGCAKTFVENNRNEFLDSSPPLFLEYDIFPKKRDYPSGQQKELFKTLDAQIRHFRKMARGAPLLFAICAPCQPFTKVSKKELSTKRKLMRKRDRNLLGEACKFVKKYKPDMILSENVSGIRDPKFGGIWEDFQTRLEKYGYVTGTKIVCTSRFGIPQFRKRSILIAAERNAVRTERFSDLFKHELLIPESDPNASIVSVAEAISGLPPIKAGQAHRKIPNHRARTLSDLNLKRISSAQPGESNIYMNDTDYGDLSLDCHRKVNRRLQSPCFTDVYTRMHPNRPSPTITTKCHSISNGRFGHFDVKQHRGISLREAAILQSFPSDYIFFPEDKIEMIARMIGNAVPPKLANFFANYLVNSIKPRAAHPA
jgi:DNA (cytosine-5)-methyltransferase 1